MKFIKSLVIILLAILSFTGSAQLKIEALPNEEITEIINISNDSISLSISINNKLEVNSLRYLPEDIELVEAQRPMPLVTIDNSWTLNNVGFSIRNTKIIKKNNQGSVFIHAYSNYLENPFHLYIKLGFDNSSAISVDIKIVNQFKKGFHDLYRSGNRTSITLGMPWLAYLHPDTENSKKIIYKNSSGYILEKFSESMFDGYQPLTTWERPPKASSVDLQFYHNPLFPAILEYSGKNVTVMLQTERTDLNIEAENIKQALWPSTSLQVAQNDTLVVIEGVFKIFSGDWHEAFKWFRNKIRNDFDFTFYKRPGAELYKKDFLAYHSFIFNHRIYDPQSNQYLIESFLKNAKTDVGGYDQFYFWHAYPRVGVDPRDQFDLYEDLPGGLNGLKDFVAKAHQMNTHVYLAYNPWDIIGHRDDMYYKQAEILGTVEADGLLLDTEASSNRRFRETVDEFNTNAMFVTEGRPDLDALEVTTTSWDHPDTSMPMPRIDLLRFIIPEHRAFQIVRWDRDRKPLIKKAFFNATGYVVWDDVFGEINLQSWDEKILIHRYKTIMHDFSDAINSINVIPLVPTLKDDLFANGFYGKDVQVYTLYQANHAKVSHFFDNRIIGRLFEVDVPDGWHLVDVWNKRPVEIEAEGNKKFVFLPQEMPEDIGCIVAFPKILSVSKNKNSWSVSTSLKVGTIELVEFDVTLRNNPTKIVSAANKIVFNKNEVEQTSDGFVMVQYRDHNKEVKDVQLIEVGY